MDVFGAAVLRERVLAAWSASPARFREDANAEEELSRGAYSDRLIVELAQNAADAAGRARTRTRLMLRLRGRTLTAANTGAPLDAAGVEGLSTLRASTKRDEISVGRFGVGFAAVLAVTDEPMIVTSAGSVRWSRAATRRQVAAVPELADELARRGDSLPVLRLPFAADEVTGQDQAHVDDQDWAGYDTAVILPLRDDRAVELVRRLLNEVDDALLLALPNLAEVVIDVGSSVRELRGEPPVDLTGRKDRDGTGVGEELSSLQEKRVGEAGGVSGERIWRISSRAGRVAGELLADRPFEERSRPSWSVSVAVPVVPAVVVRNSGDGGEAPEAADRGDGDWHVPAGLPETVTRVLHAPTPTDDRTDLPVLVIASFGLDSSRRRIVAGPLTTFLAGEIGRAYARLVGSFVPAAGSERMGGVAGLSGPGPGFADSAPGSVHLPGPASPHLPGQAAPVLDLVPPPLGVGEVDTVLRRSIRQELAETPFIPAADGGHLCPRDVNLIDGVHGAADPSALASVIVGLPAAGWWRTDVLRGLGATVNSLADVVDELAGLRLDAGQWLAVYQALEGADAEALGSLPVPLADGRLVRGPRGLLLPSEVSPDLLAPLGVRVVAPEAVHPLLRRLGAVDATAAAVLRDPRVAAAVSAAAEGSGTASPGNDGFGADETNGWWAISEAVLGLVSDAGLTSGEQAWLAGLPLRDGTGYPAPAGELLLPSSPLLTALDADPAEYAVAAELVDRFGAEVLRAVGVRDGFVAIREPDATLDPAEFWHDLDDEVGWVESITAQLPSQDLPPVVAEFVAVGDLDLVRDDAWELVLTWLAGDPETHAAVVEPALVLLADGTRRSVPSYTAWWLREHARIDGFPVTRLSMAGADPVARALLHSVEVQVDGAFAAAIGLVRSLGSADPNALLERLADPDVVLSAQQLADVYAVVSGSDPDTVDPPARLRVPLGSGSHVVDAADVVVCDGPQWLQLGMAAVIPGTAALADVLDVELAAEVFDVQISGTGTSRAVPDVAREVLGEGTPKLYMEHDDLYVGDVRIEWWIEAGTVHASTGDGLARALAWAAGGWERRWVLAEALRDPGAVPALLADEAFRS